MVRSNRKWWVGILAVALTAPAFAQQDKQPIPDAPRPQTLPDLKTITPAAPAVDAPDAPAPQQKTIAIPTQKPTATAPDDDQGPPPDMGPNAYRLHTGVNVIDVPFTVKDSKGNLVPGLTYRDVRVYENNVRQHIIYFSSDPLPLSVAVVIDQSVPASIMEKVNDALSALQGAFSPYDEVAVYTYGNGVREQTTFTAAQSARLGVVLERSKGKGRDPVMGYGGPLSQTNNINGRNVDPNTAPNRSNPGAVFNAPEKEIHTLNDAILAAAAATAKKQYRRRVVYVISDGKEYGSKAKEKDVIRYCQTNKVTVYGTLVGDTAVPGVGFLERIHLPLTMRDDILPRITAATGGQTDPEFRTRGIEQSFSKITEIVRTQYTVEYNTPESMLDGKYRKIDVRVARPNLSITAKDGYYPTAGDFNPSNIPTPTAIQ